jgi:hypothetical protein
VCVVLLRLWVKSVCFNFLLQKKRHLRPYSKSSLTLNEWRFNLSLSWASVLFLNMWRVSVLPYYGTTHPPAIQKQHWHSREAQIEPPLIECEWAFRIRALVLVLTLLDLQPNKIIFKPVLSLNSMSGQLHKVHPLYLWAMSTFQCPQLDQNTTGILK